MRSHHRQWGRLLATTALMGVLATAVAGCQTSGMSGITASSGGALGGGIGLFSSNNNSSKATTAGGEQDWRREVTVQGERYKADPRDANVALLYSEALRKTGQRAQAVAVLQQASIYHPHDKRVLGDYGRALAESGNLKEALDMLGRAHSPDQPDWRILSAQGAVLDQMGRHEDARRYYETALKIAPNEPSVLSNLGLSYALSKNLTKAEETLRSADARGSTDRRVRQNLALVVGLQGRFPEAETIARSDLPEREATENVAYLRQMLPNQLAQIVNARPARGGARPVAIASAKNPKAPKTATRRVPVATPRTAAAVEPAPTADSSARPVKRAPGPQAKNRPLMLSGGV